MHGPQSLKTWIGKPMALIELFGTVENLDKEIAKYFKECQRINRPPCVERLALQLGCSDRTLTRMKDTSDSLEELIQEGLTLEEAKEKQAFCRSIKKFYVEVRANDIERLKTRGNSGDIFVAKNHGWTDVQHIEQNITGNSNNIEVKFNIPQLPKPTKQLEQTNTIEVDKVVDIEPKTPKSIK